MIIVLLVIAQLFVGVKLQQAESIREKYWWVALALAIVVASAFLQFFLIYDRPACQ